MNTAANDMPVRVLVIEDDPALREPLVSFLKLEGMQAQGVGSLDAAQKVILDQEIDVLLLDLGLPDGNGLTWLSKRSDLKDKGVIITSARSDALTRVSGIRAGADMYLVKPVLPEEIASLIHNLMRRLRVQKSQTWLLDAKSWQLQAPDGKTIKLTHSEHAVLQTLAKATGRVVTKEELATGLGQQAEIYDYRRLEVIIRRLRNKARENWGQDLPLETAHRHGYSFTADIKIGRVG
jgi:two-component system OmpR family response regulator